MYTRGAMLFLYTETASHWGGGESMLVDLAIQRNQTLNWPNANSPTLKGAMRSAAPEHGPAPADGEAQTDGEAYWRDRTAVFGFDPNDKRGLNGTPVPDMPLTPGAIHPPDLSLLAFPVASLAGVFVWITCFQAIRDFQRMWQLCVDVQAFPEPNGAQGAGASFDPLSWTPDLNQANPAAFLFAADPGQSQGLSPALIDGDRYMVLQDMLLDGRRSSELKRFAAWLADHALPEKPSSVRTKFKRDLVVVSDAIFTSLVESGIHIITRVKIDDETGTAARSGPWDEELLPPETLLYTPILVSQPYNGGGPTTKNAGEVLAYIRHNYHGKRMQMGADATVGRGFVATRLYPAAAPAGQPQQNGAGA